jgi:cytochrome c-type biogenesis protein CcmE
LHWTTHDRREEGEVKSKGHVRLVVALSVAAMLAVFLLYTSVGGNATPSLKPSQLPGHAGLVTLAGAVVGPARGDGHDVPLRFRLRDVGGRASVPIAYRGAVPDLFSVGRHVLVQGRLRAGTFVAVPGSLVTKCPSRYVAKRKQS